MNKHASTALLILSGLLFGIALGEATLRIATRFGSDALRPLAKYDPLGILVEPVGSLGYRQRPLRTFTYGNGTIATSNTMAYRGPLVAVPKPAGVFRIILLGGSTTHGFAVNDNETIDAYMRDILGQEYPDRRFEVVNLAFDGYDSYQLYERLRADGLPLDPDLVIVNSGINDVRNARLPDLVDRDPRSFLYAGDMRRMRAEKARGRPAIWTLLKHYLYVARIGGFIRDRMIRARDASPQAAAATPSGPYPEAADYFERNLRRIDGLLAARGTPILFSTPPSAIPVNFAPTATSSRGYWVGDAATTQQYRDLLAARMQAVVDDLRAEGRSVAYVPHNLAADMFLDDAHLTPAGNRVMAEDFVRAIQPYIWERVPRGARPTARAGGE